MTRSEALRRLRVLDIVGDAERIGAFLGDTHVAGFVRDERTMFAVERLLQRIAEAVIQIGPEEMERVGADIPVRTVRAFGNMLRHQYRDLDPELVYGIARTHVPVLAAAASRALAI